LIVAADGPLVARATALGVSATTLGFPPALRNIGDAAAGGSAGQTIRRSALIAQLLTAAPEVAMYIYRLGRELRGCAPDVIHANGFKMHVLGIWARPFGTPVVWHMHDYVTTRPLMRWLLRAHAPRCAAAVTNSRSV